MSDLHVACAAEGGYVRHSAAMLHSVLSCHSEQTVHVHYMHGPDMSPSNRQRMGQMVDAAGSDISFLHIPDDRLDGLPTRGFTRKATWYRIFLPELLSDVDRVLYLDSDLLALDSLNPLFDLDMTGRYVAAVTNVFEHHHARRPAELGLAGPHVYFNAGVLLMNLDLMRTHGCTLRLLEYARAHAPELLWRDQDVLNVVLGERRLELEPRWNCMNSVLLFPWAKDVFGAKAVAAARRNPAIRHFEGLNENKPWHYLCERDMRELYANHRLHTPWPRVRPEGVTPRNVVRRLRRPRPAISA